MSHLPFMHCSHVYSNSIHSERALFRCRHSRRPTAPHPTVLDPETLNARSRPQAMCRGVDGKQTLPLPNPCCICSRRTQTAGSRGRFDQCRDPSPTTSRSRYLAFIIIISSPIKITIGILSSVKPDGEVGEATWARQSESGSTGEQTDPCTLSQATHHLPKFNASCDHFDSSADAGADVPRSLKYSSVYLKAHLDSFFEPHPLFLHATAAAELVKGPLTARHQEAFAFSMPARATVPVASDVCALGPLFAGAGWLLPAAACPCR